jgi:hypothetical protein
MTSVLPPEQRRSVRCLLQNREIRPTIGSLAGFGRRLFQGKRCANLSPEQAQQAPSLGNF